LNGRGGAVLDVEAGTKFLANVVRRPCDPSSSLSEHPRSPAPPSLRDAAWLSLPPSPSAAKTPAKASSSAQPPPSSGASLDGSQSSLPHSPKKKGMMAREQQAVGRCSFLAYSPLHRAVASPGPCVCVRHNIITSDSHFSFPAQSPSFQSKSFAYGSI